MLICKDGKLRLQKWKYWEKILKQYGKGPIFKGKNTIIVSIDNMDKIKIIKTGWYDWLINYITEPTRKITEGFKVKVVTLFNTNSPKQTVCVKVIKIEIET